MSSSARPTLSEGWYLPATTLQPTALVVFKKYTTLSEDEVLPHIIAVREKAWKVFPYPCIGSFRFLDFSISESPSYNAVVSRLQSGETLLDLGCCFGQDIRKLVSDGAPSENIFGADLQPEFIELGYDLFLDKEKLKTTFLAPVDVFDESDTAPLKTLEGKIDIVYIGSFLHLFRYEGQVRAAKRIVSLLKPKKGSLVLGRQGGSLTPGEYTNTLRTAFRHDLATFEVFWKSDVGGGEWEIDAELRVPKLGPESTTGDNKNPASIDPGSRWLKFSVKRV